jgi:hypothetical protein
MRVLSVFSVFLRAGSFPAITASSGRPEKVCSFSCSFFFAAFFSFSFLASLANFLALSS